MAPMGSEFDRRADPSRGRFLQSVLYPSGLPQRRSCLDMFRLEPAVSGLDGPFTPTRGSREGIVRHHPWQASTCLSARFTLPTRRSPGFGSCPYDFPPLETAALTCSRKLRPCWFPYVFPGDRVRLAIQAHSLVRFSKRTMEHRLPTVPTEGSRPGRSPAGLVCPIALSPTDFKPLSPPVVGCFSAFAHATCSLSVSGSV